MLRMRRLILCRVGLCVSIAVLLCIWLASRPSRAAAPAPVGPLGLPQRFGWIVFTGGSGSNASYDVVRNDISAIELASAHMGLPKALQIIVQPWNAAVSGSSEHHLANRHDLRNLFANEGVVAHQIQTQGLVTAPEFLLLQFTGHADDSGGLRWGTEHLSLDDLREIVRRALSLFHVPVVVFLDQCSAGVAAEFSAKLEPEERNSILLITASGRKTPAYSEKFRNLKRLLETAQSRKAHRIHDTFDPDKYYSVGTAGLLYALLGGASDGQGDGADVADVCDFFDALNRSSRRYEMRCAYSDPEQMRRFASGLAFTRKRLSILIARQPGQKSDEYNGLVRKLKEAFERRTREYQAEDYVRVCTALQPCGPYDVECAVTFEPDDSASGNAWNVGCFRQGRSHNPNWRGKSVSSSLVLDEQFEALAARVLDVGAWKPIPKPREFDRVSFLERGTSLLVILDQSSSISQVDPSGMKRREIFTRLVRPELGQRIAHVSVMGFADTPSRPVVCYDHKKQPDPRRAQECWDSLLMGKGASDLIAAGKTAVKILARQRPFRQNLPPKSRRGRPQGRSVVWVITDAEQNPIPRRCKAPCVKYLERKDCRPAEFEGEGNMINCKYNAQKSNMEAFLRCRAEENRCVVDGLAGVGRAFHDMGTQVNLVSLVRSDEHLDRVLSDASVTIPQLSAAAAEGSIGNVYSLGSINDATTFRRELGNISASTWGYSIGGYVAPRHICNLDRDKAQWDCQDTFDLLHFTEYNPGLRIEVADTIWEDIGVDVRLERSERLRGDEEGLHDFFPLSSTRPQADHPLGIKISLSVRSNILTLTLDSGRRPFPDSYWHVRIRYTVRKTHESRGD